MAAQELEEQKLSAWLLSQGAQRSIPPQLKSPELEPLWSFLGFTKAEEQLRGDLPKDTFSQSAKALLFPRNPASEDLVMVEVHRCPDWHVECLSFWG